MFYLNKINGICKVEKDKIIFYNGDEYKFENNERSFSCSLGNYHKYTKEEKNKKENDDGLVYWERLFSKVKLCRIKKNYRIACLIKSDIENGEFNEVVLRSDMK